MYNANNTSSKKIALLSQSLGKSKLELKNYKVCQFQNRIVYHTLYTSPAMLQLYLSRSIVSQDFFVRTSLHGGHNTYFLRTHFDHEGLRLHVSKHQVQGF